jgi:hypothetical protein
MSPYRVLVKEKGESKAYRLLVAILSKDKVTGRRRIFICEKTLPKMWNATMEEIKQVAHMQVTRKNSLILAEYEIFKDDLGLKYKVVRRSGDFEALDKNQYIQSDCLIAAMEDYLSQKDLKVERQL